MTNESKEFITELEIPFYSLYNKWTYLIIINLYTGRKRLTDLLKINNKISYKILDKKLKELEENNIIGKSNFYEYPSRVEYFLTSKGYKIVRLLKEFDSII